MKTLLANLPGVAYRCKNNLNWEMEFLSDGCFFLTGYHVHELVGNPSISFSNIIHPDDKEFVWSKIQSTLKNNTGFEIEYRIINKNNEIKWVWERGKKVSDNPEMLEGFISDITERKIFEHALAVSEERFRLALENIPDVIVIYDKDRRIKHVNIATQHLTGRPVSDYIGKKDEEIWPPEVYESYLPALKEARKKRKITTVETELMLGDEKNKYLHITCVPILNENDTIREIIGITHDLTEYKRAEKEILKLNKELEQKVIRRTEQLEKINKELQTFTYSVSHDLKAPLRGIDGYSKLLYKKYASNLSEEAQLFISNIREGTTQMNQLIEDLLAYSRLERSIFRKSKISLLPFIQDIIKPFQKEINDRGIILDLKLNDTIINADFDGLSMSVRNILENAIKFTSASKTPKITVSLKENENTWIIAIRDNGIGFNMDYKEKIFEIFQRLQRVEDYPGTGIGLAMVTKAMQRMHGRVWAESKPKQGSVFYLEIPKSEINENETQF